MHLCLTSIGYKVTVCLNIKSVVISYSDIFMASFNFNHVVTMPLPACGPRVHIVWYAQYGL